MWTSTTVNFSLQKSSEFILWLLSEENSKLATPKAGILSVDFVTDVPKKSSQPGALKTLYQFLYLRRAHNWAFQLEMAGAN